jgi:hypothetical protein
MGIKPVLSAPRSPWQRAYVERVIGTIRRECLDHLSCSTSEVCTGTSRHSWNITIRTAFTGHWRKILRSRDRSSRRSMVGSCRYRCWAGCIIDTSGAPRKSRICDDVPVGDECPHTVIMPPSWSSEVQNTSAEQISPGKLQSNPQARPLTGKSRHRQTSSEMMFQNFREPQVAGRMALALQFFRQFANALASPP